MAHASGVDGRGIRLVNLSNAQTWENRIGVESLENTSYAIKDITAGAVRLLINTSGYVGIGTTTPSFPLDVIGQANITQLLIRNNATAVVPLNTTPTFTSPLNGTLVLSNNGNESFRVTDGNNFLVGSTSTAGSVGNYATVLAGVFRSFSGTVSSVATNTYTTLFAASTGAISSYLVTVYVSADDVNNYQANVIVNTQGGTSTKVTVIASGSLLEFRMSGYNFQARQNSGGSASISYSAIRILG